MCHYPVCPGCTPHFLHFCDIQVFAKNKFVQIHFFSSGWYIGKIRSNVPSFRPFCQLFQRKPTQQNRVQIWNKQWRERQSFRTLPGYQTQPKPCQNRWGLEQQKNPHQTRTNECIDSGGCRVPSLDQPVVNDNNLSHSSMNRVQSPSRTVILSVTFKHPSFFSKSLCKLPSNSSEVMKLYKKK